MMTLPPIRRIISKFKADNKCICSRIQAYKRLFCKEKHNNYQRKSNKEIKISYFSMALRQQHPKQLKMNQLTCIYYLRVDITKVVSPISEGDILVLFILTLIYGIRVIEFKPLYINYILACFIYRVSKKSITMSIYNLYITWK